MAPSRLHKYPRTRHVEGSRLQPGDEDLEQVAWKSLHDRFVVVEEKVDGANAGVSFDAHGKLQLQSRGHFLTGGGRERHFAMFKSWASAHRDALWQRLGSRFVMYGEWVYAKHTIFYDRLPSYFLEFDLLDRIRGVFLDTPSRHRLLDRSPVASVPVLASGLGRELPELPTLVGASRFKSAGWRRALRERAVAHGLDVARAERETDPADDAEGLYLKIEDGGRVIDRLKWIRASFLTAVADADSHWLERPILPNALAPGVDVFAP